MRKTQSIKETKKGGVVTIVKKTKINLGKGRYKTIKEITKFNGGACLKEHIEAGWRGKPPGVPPGGPPKNPGNKRGRKTITSITGKRVTRSVIVKEFFP